MGIVGAPGPWMKIILKLELKECLVSLSLRQQRPSSHVGRHSGRSTELRVTRSLDAQRNEALQDAGGARVDD